MSRIPTIRENIDDKFSEDHETWFAACNWKIRVLACFVPAVCLNLRSRVNIAIIFEGKSNVYLAYVYFNYSSFN